MWVSAVPRDEAIDSGSVDRNRDGFGECGSVPLPSAATRSSTPARWVSKMGEQRSHVHVRAWGWVRELVWLDAGNDDAAGGDGTGEDWPGVHEVVRGERGRGDHGSIMPTLLVVFGCESVGWCASLAWLCSTSGRMLGAPGGVVMGSITLHVRSIVWFVTGALLATTATLMFANAWRVDAAPGDSDATFVAITPCRLADTRPAPNRVGTAGALGVAATQTFAVHGSNGQCSLPVDAVAVSLNVTASSATELSFLTFWPGGTQPLAASLNPAPGEPPTPNAVTVDLSGAGGFNVFNNVGTVNVVIDVNGYYTQASLKELASRVAALETTAAANTASIAVNASGVAGLDAAQPFVVTNRDDAEALTSTDEVVVSVAVTAPVAGQVTLHSTTNAIEATADDNVRCSITTDTANVDFDYVQWWQSPGSSGSQAQLAGTRTYDIAANTTVTYNLVCDHFGSNGGSNVAASVLTAVFTPAP